MGRPPELTRRLREEALAALTEDAATQADLECSWTSPKTCSRIGSSLIHLPTSFTCPRHSLAHVIHLPMSQMGSAIMAKGAAGFFDIGA
ncbi:hypothetical protein D1O30_18630 [Methylocystis hirsuta]|uniref:Uncharacterized protein n=1 Tax=Methylocystis hirsuta TaxID=369798 RepID=A0A3M9XTG9_9HYPH|nr:hypothetical protein D1O30_18630 [Methylocystis hirsuta]